MARVGLLAMTMRSDARWGDDDAPAEYNSPGRPGTTGPARSNRTTTRRRRPRIRPDRARSPLISLTAPKVTFI